MNTKRRSITYGLLGLLLGIAVSIAADVPYIFQSGNPIRAAEMNANFAYLAAAVSANSEKWNSAQVTLPYLQWTAVVTVPANAPRPYIVRQIHGGCSGSGLYWSVIPIGQSDPNEGYFGPGTSGQLLVAVSPGYKFVMRCYQYQATIYASWTE